MTLENRWKILVTENLACIISMYEKKLFILVLRMLRFIQILRNSSF